MTYEQILKDLENKKYFPIYFLMGEESYFIDEITDYISENVLDESEKTFNQITFYGKDTDFASIINTAKKFPMMSNHQVVIIKEAQNIKNIDDLIYYIDSPQKSTLLVINYKYGKLNKNKKVYKALQKNAILFESNKLYDNKIPQWINDYLAKTKYAITPDAVMLLVDFAGNGLSKIAKELDKLIITLPQNQNTINKQHIEANIGISKDYNNFELHKALAKKNVLKANRIINYFSNNQKNNPINVTITSLYFYFSKVLAYHFINDKSKNKVASVLRIHPFFVTEYASAAKIYNPSKLVGIISLLREYDLKSKGVNNNSTSPGELLRELIYKILH